MAVKSKVVSEKQQLISRLMSNIVVKQIFRASEDDYPEAYQKYQYYKNAMTEIDNLADYHGIIEVMAIKEVAPRLDMETCELLANGTLSFRKYLTSEEYDHLLQECRNERLDSYVEENPYYRMLMGLPPIDMDPSDFIYIDGVPIQELGPIDFYKLKRSGKLDVIISEHPDQEYLRYIGKNIGLVEARDAEQFEVLWVEDKTENNKYREIYNKERKVWMATYHNEHFTYYTEFNEGIELTTLKMRAVIQYFLYAYSPALDKTTFTKEESENLFKEFGLSFPKNMPANYRDAISFVLNYAVMMKGTNYIVKFIANKLFAGLKLYKYFIQKTHKLGLKYPIPEGTPPDQVYDVKFVLRPYDATNIIDYKEDGRDDIVMSYDEVVTMDPRWQDTEELKNAVFNEEFSYVNSKYIAIDNLIDLNEFSIGFSLISRCVIERKKLLSETLVRYNSTALDHSFFNLWIYYMALFCYIVERIRTKAPDSMLSITELYGFRIPPGFETIKLYWVWYFRQTDAYQFLEEFPEAMNDNDAFFEFLVKVDKAIGLTKSFEQVIQKCKNFDEIKLAMDVYRVIRIVSTVPESYDVVPTTDGISYIDYLETHDEDLFLLFERCVTSDTDEAITLEFDNITQFLISVFQEQGGESFPMNNLIHAVNISGMIVGGVSKYLLYILKLFKAYTADFITDGNILTLDETYNYQLSIDQIWTDAEVLVHDRWNVSQYDWFDGWDGMKPRPLTIQESFDEFFVCTPYGDMKLSY